MVKLVLKFGLPTGAIYPTRSDFLKNAITPLFDENWYLNQLNTPIDTSALDHYLVHGAENRLDPHPLFDAEWYLTQNADVAASGANPLVHFMLHGALERPPRSPHPLFDISRYVFEALGGAPPSVNPLLHYVNSSTRAQFRPHLLFDLEWYLDVYPEAHAYPPLEHYIRNSRKGVNPNYLFDSKWYISKHMRGVKAKVVPLTHYVTQQQKGRFLQTSPLLDSKWYLEGQHDVREAGVDPLAHYMFHGIKEARAPNPLFDYEYYKRSNPDVDSLGLDLFRHYLRHGAIEGRAPHPYFDTAWYRRQNAESADAQKDPLAHYLRHGRELEVDPNPYFDSAWYVRTYLKDFPEANPLVHYITTGKKAGFQPHPLFNEAKYLNLNLDVKSGVAIGLYHSGFAHFVMNGAAEMCRNNSSRSLSFEWEGLNLDCDGFAYQADNYDVTTAINAGRYRHAVEHLFHVGHLEAKQGLRAIYGSHRVVKKRKDFAGKAKKRVSNHLILYAHYDKDNIIDDYVALGLEALYAQGVDIVFISSTSEPTELSKIENFITHFLIKNEAGRDFGSWYLAIKTFGLDLGEKYDRVIFVNDSIYFPIRPLTPVFQDMERSGFNIYALSDSQETAAFFSDSYYHCQSFFLAFDKKAQRAMFPQYVENFERNAILTKWGQVREYEYGLTQAAMKAGLSTGAFLAIDDAREDILRDPSLEKWRDKVRLGLGAVNPIQDLWDLAIARFGWPGLKLELLRDNPKGLTNTDVYPDLIGDGAIPAEVIAAHQSRMKSATLLPSRQPMQIHDNARVELRERIQGLAKQQSKRLVLFAHYDPHKIIDPHIIAQLDAHAALGNDVTFITSVDSPTEINKIRKSVSTIFVKTDAGRDFGSWAIAIEQQKAEFSKYQSVLWINDSTYFPLLDAKPMFDTMESRKLDFWGVVDSYNTRWHVMSWFWSFGKKVIQDGWFDWYLQEYNPNHEKWAQIRNYEMRVPALLQDNGFSVGAYITAKDVAARVLSKYKHHERAQNANYNFTMTHDFWDIIIEEFQCPALKVELVRDNPLGINLSRLLHMIRDKTTYDPKLIADHVRRIKTSHLIAEKAVAPSAAALPHSSARV